MRGGIHGLISFSCSSMESPRERDSLYVRRTKYPRRMVTVKGILGHRSGLPYQISVGLNRVLPFFDNKKILPVYIRHLKKIPILKVKDSQGEFGWMAGPRI
jgi:hypothetical protein